MVRFVSLFVALGVSAAPALAQTPYRASGDSAAEAQSDVDKVVCKREDQIGSRIGAKKVCLTVQEWQERERIAKDATDRFQQLGIHIESPATDIIVPPNN